MQARIVTVISHLAEVALFFAAAALLVIGVLALR